MTDTTEEKMKIIHYWIEYFAVEKRLIGNNIMMRANFGTSKQLKAGHLNHIHWFYNIDDMVDEVYEVVKDFARMYINLIITNGRDI